MAYEFTAIEKKWQKYWLDNRSFAALEPVDAGDRPKAYILDMFPYPSGDGLHVGHVVQQTATDIVCRFLRMKGFNVLHPIGWDAFGLPAEQYAIKTNQHPAVTTRQRIERFRTQIQSLGMGYDWDREIDTSDPTYYRWTQWIFLQLFNSYFDPIDQKAMPIGHLINELENENLVVAPDGTVHVNPTQEGMEALGGEVRVERTWKELGLDEQRDLIDNQRLAYMDEAPVNWCPDLGTVLANEEVIDGKSEVGGFPVIKQPMRQWMLAITAYADRLLDDLDKLDWPESLKEMQRNWIGKSVGAEVDFDIDGVDEEVITVFTTRPDTLYGATYMVLAPEHPLVDRLTAPQLRADVDAYRQAAALRSERERMTDLKEKTGEFIGAYAVNPLNDEKIPIWIADYVLMGYGTGAIMAVPAHDQRDYEFATKFKLPIKTVVKPAGSQSPPVGRAFEEPGIAVNSLAIEGQPTAEAKEFITDLIEGEGIGHRAIKFKLRDWLFSRQRYWGEPFPILLDANGHAYAVDESQLPVKLPEMTDFRPTGTPDPPLSKARDWIKVERDGTTLFRETNTMPQWAGSCWYYLRYLDPTNPKSPVDPEKEKYWMPADLYVGGVEHAVLHLLYSRFWHKVLFDLGHVSTPEPFARLVNQGLILGETEFHLFVDDAGKPVSMVELYDIDEEATPQGVQMTAMHKGSGKKLTARRIKEDEVERTSDGYALKKDPKIRVDARSFKMSKSRGNVVNPDKIVADYGADAFRLYEMYMGPLESQKPWSTRDIVGMSRFLASVYRNLIGDEELGKKASIVDVPIPDGLDRQMHRTIKKVGDDIDSLRFNTAIAELIKLNNEMVGLATIPRDLAQTFIVLLSPFAPHLAEEIWSRLGNSASVGRHPWPKYDAGKLADAQMQIPVQVNGKLRATIDVAADAAKDDILATARAAQNVKPWIDGKNIVKQIYVEKKLVNFVVQ